MSSRRSDSTNDISNYRPISLLSMPVVFNTLHSIIYRNQFGFRAGSSTTQALISITETIKKTIDEKMYGCGIFIDFKKSLWHS